MHQAYHFVCNLSEFKTDMLDMKLALVNALRLVHPLAPLNFVFSIYS